MINYKTRLIQIDHPGDADLVRKAMVANAMSVKDISGADPNTVKIFTDLLGPINGTWDLRRTSTCGVVARGLFRRIMVDMPALYKNYVIGTAITAELNFAQKLKPRSAWVTPTPGLMPNPGDYILIGSGMMTHVLTMIRMEDGYIISIDGGQVGNLGFQCIKERKRQWIVNNGKTFIDNRSVVGWISIDMLPFRMGEQITVPEGWETIY
jgi:hypothetical protein